MYLITLSVALAESKSVSDRSGASQTAAFVLQACNIVQAMLLCRDVRSMSSWGRLPVNDH